MRSGSIVVVVVDLSTYASTRHRYRWSVCRASPTVRFTHSVPPSRSHSPQCAPSFVSHRRVSASCGCSSPSSACGRRGRGLRGRPPSRPPRRAAQSMLARRACCSRTSRRAGSSRGCRGGEAATRAVRTVGRRSRRERSGAERSLSREAARTECDMRSDKYMSGWDGNKRRQIEGRYEGDCARSRCVGVIEMCVLFLGCRTVV